MDVKKYIYKAINLLVVIFFGFQLYGEFIGKQSSEEVRESFERYFTDSDERIKMIHFKVDKNTVVLVLEVSGIGKNLGPNDKAKIKSNSRKHFRDKVCSNAQLVQYMNDENDVLIDIRNGDSDRSENIITLGFSKFSCV